MDMRTFSWNEEKQRENLKKHGITFLEAATVFDDANALVRNDPDHSHDEDRFIIIGFSERARLLIVCHCYRTNDVVIRIISARKANRKEQKDYGGREK